MAVRVKVHKNEDALNRAARRYNDRMAPPGADDERVLGVCHRFHMADDPVVALVRFAPPNTGAAVVAHEMAHAAIWLWEIENKFDRKKPLNCTNDEWFCWILGELVRQTTIQFYEKKVYD